MGLVPLLRRSRDRPPPTLPLGLPGPGDQGWPDEADAGRGSSFAARALHELGQRGAYEPEAHAVADRLTAEALGRFALAGDPVDAPYLQQVLTTAARIGAGLAAVERSQAAPPPGQVDRHLAGALWLARRQLPGMAQEQADAAAWFLLAGFWLARGGPERADGLLASLLEGLPGDDDAGP
jgi:hypothetical protein